MQDTVSAAENTTIFFNRSESSIILIDLSRTLKRTLPARQLDEQRSEKANEDGEDFASDERRQHDRSRLIVDLHFDGADSTGIASTKDISLGGLYMTTSTEIPVGARLALRIPVGDDHVVVRGEVVYSNPGEGVGVKFQDLSSEEQALMKRALPQT